MNLGLDLKSTFYAITAGTISNWSTSTVGQTSMSARNHWSHPPNLPKTSRLPRSAGPASGGNPGPICSNSLAFSAYKAYLSYQVKSNCRKSGNKRSRTIWSSELSRASQMRRTSADWATCSTSRGSFFSSKLSVNKSCKSPFWRWWRRLSFPKD